MKKLSARRIVAVEKIEFDRRDDRVRARRVRQRDVHARHNQVEVPGFGVYPCLGVFAGVSQNGTIARGDAVELRD